MALNLQTPGVYTVELNAFPNSVVAVATAVPAFIGYTARADYRGGSLLFKPTKITSLVDFMTMFGEVIPGSPGVPVSPAPPGYQYKPNYYVVPSTGLGDLRIGGAPFDIEPDPATIYYLYNSVRLFYANGGSDAYIVSVGGFGKANGKPKQAADPLVNPSVKLADLERGLAAIEEDDEPTMLLVPDSSLLKPTENATLMQSMISLAGRRRTMVAILDVQAGLEPDPMMWQNAVTDFRTAVGVNSLNFASAYYPFLKTTMMSSSDVDYTNAGGAAALAKLLPEYASDPVCKGIVDSILKPPASGAASSEQSDNALLNASATYVQIQQAVLERINTLPPSGAIAGIITMVDNSEGCWKAPANVSLTAVTDTTFKITDAKQASLNVDAATGKSVNVVRMFVGQGVLVWGARTLDGNSLDWRYLNVRRTMTMIEQSIKLAARAYVFEPNDANTWSTVKSSLDNFLSGLWSQGALAGPTPESAFSVAIGLGSTMTGQDILEGRMNITVKVAITHPAEFIVISYIQQMQKAA